MIKIIILLLLSSTVLGESSYDYYAKGEFNKAKDKIFKEILEKVENPENLLDMIQDIFAQSKDFSVQDTIKMHQIIKDKNPSSYINQRVDQDIIMLQKWNKLVKKDQKSIISLISKAKQEPETIDSVNHKKRSELRFYRLIVQKHSEKDPSWNKLKKGFTE